MENPRPVVSVIIPVYNAAPTLPICLEALTKQDYTFTEFIFVNDASSDNSLVLLERFAEGYANSFVSKVKVISHPANSGVAVARNTGLEHATGTYIYYVDADDRLEENAISLLVEEAVKEGADIVGCNWFLTFDKNEREMNQPSFVSSSDAIEKMMKGTMRWNLWLFLVKRSLYELNNVRFLPEMNMGEDMMVMIKLFAAATKVVYVDQALYHYRQSNATSLTKTYSESHMQQVTANVEEVTSYLVQQASSESLQELLMFLKLNIKLPLLISEKRTNYERWLAWFPEANAYVMKNKALSLRTRILQYCAVRRWFWLLKIYNVLVIRFVYGILYR